MNQRRELSSLSYTNKDFNSIYVELLEYAKQLSYKWDPTASDESDPGVVLLKLASIIGDKDSYNIDKNILELMPASVTQIPAARQLFEQCGYSMRYYRSAEGFVNVTIKEDLVEQEEGEDPLEYKYTVPRFTMFSDADSTVIYTTVEPADLVTKVEKSINVIEGVAVNYSINNDPLITMQNLDVNNRLYFTETQIAENGIFITNVNTLLGEDNSDWVRVDNLEVQPKGSRCYKFGITIDSSSCYIEFPEDIESLIGGGLNITYVLTSGSTGNVSAGTIRNFYVETKFIATTTTRLGSEEVDASAEKITIKNPLPILTGLDPETIDEAYRSYKRVRDTFDTLVSCKDYSDYMVTVEKGSNGYVCDRTNDPVHSYKLLARANESSVLKTITETTTSDNFFVMDKDGKFVSAEVDSMNAFDLCIYALQYSSSVIDTTTFKTTFTLTDGSDYVKFLTDTSEGFKSIQHNFIDFESNRILMLKNKYPITASIIPKQTLSEIEKYQVIYNVETALCKALNAKQLDFGDPVSIDLIQETILNADDRIKNLIDFTTLSYETYAVYKDSEGNFQELRIDQESLDGGYVKTSITKNQFNLSTSTYYKYNEYQRKFVRATTYEAGVVYYIHDDTKHKLWKTFRAEIFAKNVLAGVTPLYQQDDAFTFGVNQIDTEEFNGVTHITTSTKLTFKPSDDNNNSVVSNKIRENESLLLVAPNFVDENSFSSYVKILYQLSGASGTNSIPANSIYELKHTEYTDYIIFFYKEADADEDYTYIKYVPTLDKEGKSSKTLAGYITPEGFALKQQTMHYKVKEQAGNVYSYFANLPAGKGKTSSLKVINDVIKVESGLLSISETDFVKTYLNSEDNLQVLTGTKAVKTKIPNKIHINNKKNGCFSIYWMLNRTNEDGEYVLFDKDQTTYTLKSGEYFLYANADKTTLHILGEGTLIERSADWEESRLPIWLIPHKDIISYSTLMSEGIDALAGKWVNIAPDTSQSDDNKLTLHATEQQQILVGPGNIITITKSSSEDLTNVEISSAEETELKNCSISYQDVETGTVTKINDMQTTTAPWRARMLLNIDCSSTKPQKLFKDQKFELKNFLYPEDTQLIEGGDSEEDDPYYILTSKKLNLVGGEDVLVADTLNDDIDVLRYKNLQNEEDKEKTKYISYQDMDQSAIIELTTSTESSFTLPKFKALKGSYLLQIYASAEVDSISLSVAQDDYTLEPLFDNNSNIVKTYKLNVLDDVDIEDLTLSYKVTIEDYTTSATIKILPLFKYTTNNLEKIYNGQDNEETFEESVIDQLSNLDKEQEFDYTYRPESPIHNPLESHKFLSKKHVFNKYTICEWTTDVENNVTVYDVVR